VVERFKIEYGEYPGLSMGCWFRSMEALRPVALAATNSAYPLPLSPRLYFDTYG